MIAQAYSGSRLGLNVNGWRFVKIDRLQGPPRWDLLRQDLEQSETSLDLDHQIPERVRNQRTQITGYRLLSKWFPKDRKEALPADSAQDLIKTKDILQHGMVLLCVRQSMPLGARAQVPLERNAKAMKLLEELDTMRNDSFYNQRALKEAMGMETEGSDRRQSEIQNELHRIKCILGEHASDLLIREHVVSTEVKGSFGHTLRTECVQVDVPVVPTQKCFTCQRMGHHHKDACFLQENSPEKPALPVMPWGASKFVQSLT